MKLLSHVQLFETPWTVAYQVPLSMVSSRQKYWSGLLFLLQEIFQTQELNPGPLHCKQMLYRLNHQGSLYRKKKKKMLTIEIVYYPVPLGDFLRSFTEGKFFLMKLCAK